MKIRLTLVSIACLAAVALAACGPVNESSAGSSPGPDDPISSDPCPSGSIACTPPPTKSGPRYQLVTPQPGMADLHRVAWRRVTGSGRNLLVRFYSGVEPCSVLDHVDVSETDRRVKVTLYEGHDPNSDNVACIEIAVLKAVRIRLDRALGDRTVVDGSTPS